MRDGFDEPLRTAEWELGVGIQRDHVPDLLRQRPDAQELPVFPAIQKTVEFLEFPSFTFPADPAVLGLAPHPRSVEEQEPALAVTRIQLLYAFHCQPQQTVVLRHLTLGRVREVRHEGEPEIRTRVREVAYFQPIDLAADRIRC